MISDVPKMSIVRVMFTQGTHQDNSTGEIVESINVLPDEVIAHRMAMLPIPTRHDEFHFQDKCPNCQDLVIEDRGCPLCQILYSVSATGTEDGKTITAGDLNVLGDDTLQIPDGFQTIPITKLYAGQYLEAYAYAMLGRGRDHAKWTPVSGVSFTPRKTAVIKNKGRAEQHFFSLDLGFSIDEFKKNRLDDPLRVIELSKALNHVGKGSGREEKFDGAIVLEEEPNQFVLNFETDGSMTPEIALREAAKELEMKFNQITTDLADSFSSR